MKTFIYDVADIETGDIIENDRIITLPDECDAGNVKAILEGLTEKAVNVKEINCAELAQTIIDAHTQALKNYDLTKNLYTREDKDIIVNWRLGKWAAVNEIYEKMRFVKNEICEK